MISRKWLVSILLGVAGVMIMTWRIGMLPARISIINQSGTPIIRVAVTTEAGRFDVGSIENGQTRRLSVSPTANMRLTFEQNGPHVWNAPKGLSGGQSLVLYVTPNGRVDARDRIGTFSR